MAALGREDNAWTETRVVSAHELLHAFRAEESQRILERLNSRTMAEAKRDLELRRAAAARLAGQADRRSASDRRSGRDRRSTAAQNTRAGGEERRRGERRSGRDRRLRHVALRA
jgi:hypothetical protein